MIASRWWLQAFQRWRRVVLSIISVTLCGVFLLLVIQGRQQTTHVRTLTVDTKTSEVFVHANITTTVFWIGEQASNDNGHIANVSSAWDEQWQMHYGGIDSPTARSQYYPLNFTPRENPFYVALPYDDINNASQRKSTAKLCPNTKQLKQYSWCKNAWIAIHHDNNVAYAQWEDVGPYQEDDTVYVFGTSQPRNHIDPSAGLDVSPAVRDYLHLGDVSNTNWNFVPAGAVPPGPWRQIVTSSPGNSID